MAAPVLRPLSLGEVLDVSFGLYRAKFAPLLTISVACQLIPSVLRIFLSSSGEMFVNLPLLLAYYLLAFILSAIGIAASTFIVSDAYLGRDASATAALGRAFGMLGRLLAISFMSSLLIGLGFLLMIAPGVILMSGLILATVVAVLESSPNATAAMGRSWDLTRGYRGKVLLTMLCVLILLMVPTITVGALWAIVGGLLGAAGGVAMLVITGVLTILIYPFFYVVMTVLYYDLRVRKEGFDLELLAAGLQQA